MKIKYIIPSGSDAGTHTTASHLLRVDENSKHLFTLFGVSRTYNTGDTDVKTWVTKGLNSYGERVFNLPRVNLNNVVQGEDPILKSFKKLLSERLFPSKLRDDKSNFMNSLGFKYFDYNVNLYYGRTNNRYFINGTNINKTDLLTAMAKIIMRSTLTRSGQQLINYSNRVIDFPHNVLYALENRTPYYFMEDFLKTEVVINTKLISDKECVLEISESIWGTLSLKELNGFIEYFKFGRRRHKKWIDITLENLWKSLMGEEPTRTELEKMRQWLLQHRTQDLIEDRATKLLFDIDAENPNIRFVQFMNPKNKALFVRGKYCDWVIVHTGDGMKRGRQDVTTYQIQKEGTSVTSSRRIWKGHCLSSSICIDNVSSGSSIGDQLTARALALVNEEVAAHHLYTIKPFITEGLRDGSVKSPRLDMSTLNDWSQRAANKYILDKEAKK